MVLQVKDVMKRCQGNAICITYLLYERQVAEIQKEVLAIIDAREEVSQSRYLTCHDTRLQPFSTRGSFSPGGTTVSNT